ncbi:hypothetical protein EDB80DRAFT_452168 [Ilyonectria destructans]|nr:hypothetical protein EDB80DRAFT_452168 [Ilyonectria destructans]
MRSSLKVGVYETFLLGIINIIFDTIRFATIKASAIDTEISISTIGLWSTLDCNIGVVIACLLSPTPYFNSSDTSTTDNQKLNKLTASKTSEVKLNMNASVVSRDPYNPRPSSLNSNDDLGEDHGAASILV